MVLECPRGCKRRGRPIPLKNLSGWKKHMTQVHGSYSPEELAATAGGGIEATRPTGHDTLEDYQATLGHTEEEIPSAQAGADAGQAAPAAPAETTVRARKVTAGMKKFRKMINEIPKSIFKGQGIEISDEEQDSIDEAMDFLQDLFGLEIEVPEKNLIIRSRFLALLYPICVLLFIFFRHKIGEVKLGNTSEIHSPGGSGGKRQDVGSGADDGPGATGSGI